MERRVVITGLGVVSPVGIGKEPFWESLVNGISGVDKISLFDIEGHQVTIAAEVKNFDSSAWVDPKEAKRMDRYTQFAMVATSMAMEDAGLEISEEMSEMTGVIIGSGIGGISTFEAEFDKYIERGPKRVSPLLVPMMIGDMAAGLVAIRYNAKGPNMCIVSACASGAHSIGEAYETIRRGDSDVIIAGAAEAPITRLTVAGFASMKALSFRNDDPKAASRPFDNDRDGFVIGEGAGIVILEEYEHARKRGAKIYAELAGYGATADAYHMTAPAPEGEGAQRAMKIALRKAGLAPDQIDYINAHGTSTPLNDKYESAAMRHVFGSYAKSLAVSSTKSVTGHLLGAAGPIECVAAALTIERCIIPPTMNYTTPDPDCDLDYVPNTARKAIVRTAMSNSFGFGGHNASLLLKKI